MDVGEAIAVFCAGVCAGTINVVVGSGTLITFPVLLAVGYSPLVANMSNNLGLVPGAVAGAVGYRAELRGQEHRAVRLLVASVLGAAAGGALLLALPASAFREIVPAFIAVALVLIVFQKRIVARTGHREWPAWVVPVGTFVTGIYGGYFGAAQGILLLALLGVTLRQTLQRSNALKNILAGANNGTAAIAFLIFGHVAWGAVALIAAGATLGGIVGSRYGRRLPDPVLRAVIVVVGCVAIVKVVVG